MNQSIEAVKARGRDDPFTTPYFSGLEMYNLEMRRRAARHAPPWPYDSYEELDEAMRLAAEPMHPPTAAELDRMARMAAQWATTSSPAYVADAAQIAGTPIYVAGAAAAATSAT